jgi:hypothetical protein
MMVHVDTSCFVLECNFLSSIKKDQLASFIDNDFKGYLLNKVEHLTNESRQMTDCEEW